MVKKKNYLDNDIAKPIMFVAVLMTLVVLFANTISSLNFVAQFILVGVPISFVIFYYFNKIGRGRHNVYSLFTIAISWDLVMPPFVVNLTGQISSQALLSGTATDYFFGSIWQSIGFNGIALFYLTYVVTFALLFILATKVLDKK